MACLFQKIVSFDKESYFCIETINIKLSFHSMNFVEELKWRGMVHTMMPGTEELFEKGIVTAYLGIDPTADSLHIGHLCGVMMLRHFQRCGHKPIALLGGATGMIGDPSGKSQERNLLDENTLRHNQECIKKQLSKFLDFDSDAPNHAELVNNYDWMKDFSFLDFAQVFQLCAGKDPDLFRPVFYLHAFLRIFLKLVLHHTGSPSSILDLFVPQLYSISPGEKSMKSLKIV